MNRNMWREAAQQQQDGIKEVRVKKKSNLLRVKGESINSTCTVRLAKQAGKLHMKKYSKHLPPTIFLPLDFNRCDLQKRQNVQLVFRRGPLRAALCRTQRHKEATHVDRCC